MKSSETDETLMNDDLDDLEVLRIIADNLPIGKMVRGATTHDRKLFLEGFHELHFYWYLRTLCSLESDFEAV